MKFIILLLTLNLNIAFANRISWQNLEGFNLISKKNEVFKSNKKVGVFYFLSATCPCSKGTFEYLNELQKKYPNFQFMGFHSSKLVSSNVAQNYFSHFDINFPILLDKKLKYANKFEALKTPHVFVLGEKGEVLYHGGVTNSRFFKNAKKFYLENALQEIASGKVPSKQYARALGCYIQR